MRIVSNQQLAIEHTLNQIKEAIKMHEAVEDKSSDKAQLLLDKIDSLYYVLGAFKTGRLKRKGFCIIFDNTKAVK